MTHILLIDDAAACLEALSETMRLRMSDVVIHAVESAAAGLFLLSTGEYDAVVSDIQLPGVNGLELLKRSRMLRPEIPVLLITGHSDLNVEDRALRLGAYAVIQKPLEREAFIALLIRAVRSATLSRWVREQQVQVNSHEMPSRRPVPETSLSHGLKGKTRCKPTTSLT